MSEKSQKCIDRITGDKLVITEKMCGEIKALNRKMRRQDTRVCSFSSSRDTEVNWFEKHTWGLHDDFSTIVLKD